MRPTEMADMLLSAAHMHSAGAKDSAVNEMPRDLINTLVALT